MIETIPSQERSRASNTTGIRLYDLYFHAVILAAPLIVYGILIDGISLRLSRILIIGSLPLQLWRFITKPRLILRDRFCILCLVPYLAYTTISALWSQNVETGTTTSRLGGLYEVFFLYCLCIGADLSPVRFLRFVKVYVFSAVIPVGIALWQFANNIWMFDSSELPFKTFVIEGKYDEAVTGLYFRSSGIFSRLSGTFAEPVIFSSYLCSVLLFTFALKPVRRPPKIVLRVFQVILFFVIVFALSKLALLSVIIGFVWLATRYHRLRVWILALVATFAAIVLIMDHFGMLAIFDRLTNETGHWELLVESIQTFTLKSYLIGEGIGSVPYGSFHRLVLSRVFESGLVGLVFVIGLSLLPFQFMRAPVCGPVEQRIKYVCVAVLLAIIFGLHGYDYFIHLFTWTVIGATVSCFNALRSQAHYRKTAV